MCYREFGSRLDRREWKRFNALGNYPQVDEGDAGYSLLAVKSQAGQLFRVSPCYLLEKNSPTAARQRRQMASGRRKVSSSKPFVQIPRMT